MSYIETLIHETYYQGDNTDNGDSATVAEALGAVTNAAELEHVISLITDGAPTLLNTTADCGSPGKDADLGLDEAENAELDALERIINPVNNLLPVAFLAEGVERQKSVARIALKRAHRGLPAGSGWGTGWLVSNDLLMTNNHVIPTKAFAKTVRAEFNYQNKIDGTPEAPDWYDLDPDSFFETNAALDYTLVRVKCRSLLFPQVPVRFNPGLNGEGGLEFVDEADDVIGFTPQPGGLPDISPSLIPRDFTRPFVLPRFCLAPGRRWGHLQLPTGRVLLRRDMHVNIVQHPRGRRKEVAVQQNRIDRIHSTVVRYTTDTEPGSSGSPVFDNKWDLLAIHHAGGDRQGNVWINNEGIRIESIVQDLRRRIPSASPVRRQLGI